MAWVSGSSGAPTEYIIYLNITEYGETAGNSIDWLPSSLSHGSTTHISVDPTSTPGSNLPQAIESLVFQSHPLPHPFFSPVSITCPRPQPHLKESSG